jgi:acetyl esterase
MLDPQARALIDLMVARQVPPTHTLNHDEARRFYRERRTFTQPEPPNIGDLIEPF